MFVIKHIKIYVTLHYNFIPGVEATRDRMPNTPSLKGCNGEEEIIDTVRIRKF